jgi:hypothetical protein
MKYELSYFWNKYLILKPHDAALRCSKWKINKANFIVVKYLTRQNIGIITNQMEVKKKKIHC